MKRLTDDQMQRAMMGLLKSHSNREQEAKYCNEHFDIDATAILDEIDSSEPIAEDEIVYTGDCESCRLLSNNCKKYNEIIRDLAKERNLFKKWSEERGEVLQMRIKERDEVLTKIKNLEEKTRELTSARTTIYDNYKMVEKERDKLKAELKRYTARVKDLEARDQKAIALLNGDGS